MEEDKKNKLKSFFTLVGGVMLGDVEEVKKMLDQGEKVDVRFIDLEYDGERISDSPIIAETDTPLLIAVKTSANTEVIQLLLERGADLSARDENGKTALEIAKERELTGLARMLENHLHNS